MLDVARPGSNISAQFRWRAVPIDTVKAVADAGFIEDVRYRPSAATELSNFLSLLSQDQLRDVKLLSANPVLIENNYFQSMPPEKRAKLLITAYKNIRYKALWNPHDTAVSKASHQLLLSRSRLGKVKGKDIAIAAKMPSRPDQGHHSRALSIMVGQEDLFGGTPNEIRNDVMKLSFRPAYHSLADNPDGFDHGAQINFFQSTILISEDDAILTEFNVIDIISLSPRDSFFKPTAWRVNFGISRPNSKGKLAWSLVGGPGRAYEFGGKLLTYGLALVHGEYNSDFHHHAGFAAGIEIGFVYYGNKWTSHGDYQQIHFADSPVQRQKTVYALNRQISQNSSFRLNVQRVELSGTVDSEVTLGMQYHF